MVGEVHVRSRGALLGSGGGIRIGDTSDQAGSKLNRKTQESTGQEKSEG